MSVDEYIKLRLRYGESLGYIFRDCPSFVADRIAMLCPYVGELQ